jgi:signal peptidase I
MVVGESPGRTILRGLSVALLLLVFSRTVVVPIRATGISMLPTYADGQLLFFNAVAYRFANPARGDIVAITLEARESVLVKRVVALPGERVRIEEGTVLVDDVPLPEPYLRGGGRWNIDELTLAADEYFVVGDNRSMAPGLHTFGAVTRDRLFARLMF